MAKKDKQKPSATERFLLALDDPTTTLKYKDFEFDVKLLSLIEEAKVTQRARDLLGLFFTDEELKDYKVPTLEVEEKEGKKEMKPTFVSPNLDNPAHRDYVFSQLPTNQASLINAAAYLDLVVTEIRYKGNKFSVKRGDEVFDINTFSDFISAMSSINGISLVDLITNLSDFYTEWSKNIDITPVEVKN